MIISKLSTFTQLIRYSVTIPQRVQFAALPYRQGSEGIEVLLITSLDTRRWIIPKGWPVKNGDPISTVVTEAWEEAGLSGEVNPAPHGEYSYRKKLDAGHEVDCRVVVYPMAVKHESADYPEADDRSRMWVSPGEAARRVDEPGLKELLLDSWRLRINPVPAEQISG